MIVLPAGVANPDACECNLKSNPSFFRLCVVLFTTKGKHDQGKAKLRLLAQQGIFSSERVHFTYIYEDIQTRVATAIRAGLPTSTNTNVTVLKVSLLEFCNNIPVLPSLPA